MNAQHTRAWFAERIADADARGSRWLADGNEALERGNKTKAERCYEKGQYWMDRSNELRERAILAPSLTSSRRENE